jgi:recombination endonuclease VII
MACPGSVVTSRPEAARRTQRLRSAVAEDARLYRRGADPPTVGRCLICHHEALLITDHCHRHGWVRERICQSCNGHMRLFDEGTGTAGLPAKYAAHWRRCPECAASGESPYERNYRQASHAAGWRHSAACLCGACGMMPE